MQQRKQPKELLSVGTKVTWTSQAAGSWKRKHGVILAVVLRGQSCWQHIDQYLKQAGRVAAQSNVHGCNTSLYDRYLIRVEGPRSPHFYAPKVTQKLQVER